MLWLFVLFPGGISSNPRVPYTVFAAPWLDFWLTLEIPNITCVNKMVHSDSEVEVTRGEAAVKKWAAIKKLSPKTADKFWS